METYMLNKTLSAHLRHRNALLRAAVELEGVGDRLAESVEAMRVALRPARADGELQAVVRLVQASRTDAGDVLRRVRRAEQQVRARVDALDTL